MSPDPTLGSAPSRPDSFARLGESFDVLVVGGGATGLGIALDAAVRGYRTALVEAGDFAQATSSRSTKLIHGGVRYLASGQMHLVYEALHERAVLRRNAPHLVEPLAFLIPTHRTFDLAWFGAGLTAYNLLSGSATMGPTHVLGRDAALKRLPTLARNNLKGGILYHDAQFNDARLALAVARTAQLSGAVILNYTRCLRLVQTNGRTSGAVVQDLETGSEFEVSARVVVNATGIFVDRIRSLDDPKTPSLLSVSRGSHIVVDARVLGSSTAIMVPKTSDGRVIFAIPWQGRVVIGTTDIPAESSEMEPGFLSSEIDYLLEHINPYLEQPVGRHDVRAVFSGLRPLVTGSANTTSKLSREHHIDASASGLITVAGGKWTTYRRMAQDTLDFAIKHGQLEARPCTTATTRLQGAPETPVHQSDLLREYGSEAPLLHQLAAADSSLADPIVPGIPLTGAMVLFAVRYEMARTIEDVLSRRSRSLLLNATSAEDAAPRVAELMAAELGRAPGWAAQQTATFRQLADTFYKLPA